MAAGLLWFYSTTYKRQFLIGNLIVSILTAVVPFVVVIFEVPMLNRAYGDILIANHMNFNNIIGWVGGFSFFAFLSTLIREIIKDVEDFQGDAEYGRNTLPIVLGIRATKITLVVLILFLIFCLGYIYATQLSRRPGGERDLLTLFWFALFLILPLIYLVFRLIAASGKQDYHFCSNLTKVVMLHSLFRDLLSYPAPLYTLKADVLRRTGEIRYRAGLGIPEEESSPGGNGPEIQDYGEQHPGGELAWRDVKEGDPGLPGRTESLAPHEDGPRKGRRHGG